MQLITDHDWIGLLSKRIISHFTQHGPVIQELFVGFGGYGYKQQKNPGTPILEDRGCEK